MPTGGVDRIARAASRPGLETASTVARVSRFDGRTKVVAVRTDDGWRRSKRIAWSRTTAEALRGDAREVLLTRFFRRARVSLAWIPAATEERHDDRVGSSRP